MILLWIWSVVDLEDKQSVNVNFLLASCIFFLSCRVLSFSPPGRTGRPRYFCQHLLYVLLRKAKQNDVWHLVQASQIYCKPIQVPTTQPFLVPFFCFNYSFSRFGNISRFLYFHSCNFSMFLLCSLVYMINSFWMSNVFFSWRIILGLLMIKCVIEW